MWENGKDKIAYQKLIKDYVTVGLKLADLRVKDKAMKVKWVQLDCFSDLLLSELLEQYIPLSKEHRWDCNISEKDICLLIKEPMIRDIFKAWAAINFHNPMSVQQVSNQSIWFNSWMKINGKHLWYRK